MAQSRKVGPIGVVRRFVQIPVEGFMYPNEVELQWSILIVLYPFNPNWVSLQFVPFGFHPKGLPFGLPRHLMSIIGSRPLHWMFHELWVLWNFPLSLRK